MQEDNKTGADAKGNANSAPDSSDRQGAAGANKGNSKKAAKPKETTSAQKGREAYIYCGPNLPGGILFSGALFKGRIPKHIDGACEKLPEIKKLFVEVRLLPAFKNKVAEMGSKEHSLYQYVEQEIRKGVLKNGI